MPADTNPAGDIFGGWLMAQMDLARRARGRVATVAVEAVTFRAPEHVGDEVSLYATLRSTGRRSVRLQVEAWTRERHAEETRRMTQAVFTFVALDDAGRPHPLPLDAP